MSHVMIYEMGANFYSTGREKLIRDNEGAPPGWTRGIPPTIVEGEYLRWRGGWSITLIPPPVYIEEVIVEGEEIPAASWWRRKLS